MLDLPASGELTQEEALRGGAEVKRLMIIAVAVLALGVVAIGGAAADEDDGLVGSFLARVAEKLGVSEDKLQTAVDEAKDEAIDEAVAEGKLTEDQAERLRERDFGFAPGFRGPRFGRGFGFHGMGGPKIHVREAASQVLGMSKDELKAELEDGDSLADVALSEKGLSLDELTDQLLDEIQTLLDTDVADGKLTQDQADNIFERLQEKIDDIVSREGGFGCPHRDSDESSGTEETSEVTA
jgi:polyhydroxyalkanoate synthesis regulator phasin